MKIPGVDNSASLVTGTRVHVTSAPDKPLLHRGLLILLLICSHHCITSVNASAAVVSVNRAASEAASRSQLNVDLGLGVDDSHATVVTPDLAVKAAMVKSGRSPRRHDYRFRARSPDLLRADPGCTPSQNGFYPNPSSEKNGYVKYWCLSGKQLPKATYDLVNPSAKNRIAFYVAQVVRADESYWSTASKWWGLDASELTQIRENGKQVLVKVLLPLQDHNRLPTNTEFKQARYFLKQLWNKVGAATSRQSTKWQAVSDKYEEIIKVNRDAYAVTKVAIPEFLKFMSNTNVPGVKQWAASLDLVYNAVVVTVDGILAEDPAEVITMNVLGDSFSKLLAIAAGAFTDSVDANKLDKFAIAQMTNFVEALTTGEKQCRKTGKPAFSIECHNARKLAYQTVFFSKMLGEALKVFAPSVTVKDATAALKSPESTVTKVMPAVVYFMYYLPINVFLKQLELVHKKE